LGEKPREFNVLLRTHAPQQTMCTFNHIAAADALAVSKVRIPRFPLRDDSLR
jgi:hypothetical protein